MKLIPMVKWLFLPFRAVYVLYVFVLFVALMLLVLPWLIPAFIMGTIRGGNLLYRICGYWAASWMFLAGFRTKTIHTRKQAEPETCIYVANHGSYMDIPMIFQAISHPIRILGKVEMANVPLFGWIYKTATVTVDRSSPVKRAASLRRLRAILRSGISILIFPEGTFNIGKEPLRAFYDGAFKLALEMQAPIQPIIFPDAVDRMHHSSIFSVNPGICRSVYLEPVSVSGLTISDLPQLKQQVYAIMDAGLRKYKR